MAFDSDLPIGEIAEDLVADSLERLWGVPSKKMPGYFKGYDLELGQRKVEVKYDRMSEKTGNVAIEYQYKGYPSGIKSTKATHWAFVIGGEIWIASVQRIWGCLIENIGSIRKVSGGDGKQSKMLLVPMGVFKTIFERIELV